MVQTTYTRVALIAYLKSIIDEADTDALADIASGVLETSVQFDYEDEDADTFIV